MCVSVCHGSLSHTLSRCHSLTRTHTHTPYVHLQFSCSLQELQDWKVSEDGTLEVNVVLLVKSTSQKVIVIGKGGAVVTGIASKAALELQAALGRPVTIALNVKVSERTRSVTVGGHTKSESVTLADHSNSPFVQVAAKNELERKLNATPL